MAARALASVAEELAIIIDFPLEPALVTAARAPGCRAVDGGTMAVGQAIGTFELPGRTPRR